MPTANDLIDRYIGRTMGVRPATPVRGDPACECPPACPSCGGLDCLCRPRFFAGQVLTEDDLNRLENYVIAKGKLHNRYLHGPGVVCGLEVVCDFCDAGSVTVKPGYAIAPCGEDIIVCKDAKASICDLISRCKPRDGDCDPYGSQAPTQCKDGIQRWVLSICYDERPSRGVQPLMSEPCSCGGSCGCGCGTQGAGCGCGGTTGGGCQCGGRSAATPAAKSMSKAAAKYNPQCEPTLICEGFRFTASKYVDPQRRLLDPGRFGIWGVLAGKAEQFGPLLSRLIACYLRATEIRDAFSQVQLGDQAKAADIALAYGEYLDALREFAAEHLSHRCDIARQLDQLQPPKPGFTAAGSVAVSATEWQAAFGRLNDLWLEVFRECFCSALLPPCPECETSDCIPLAVVTIDANNCRVIEICNWQAREFALTLPALYYWTSFINWGAIRDAIARLCCTGGPELWTLIFRAFDNIIKSNSSSLSSGTGVAAMAGTTSTQAQPATAATGGGPSTTGAGPSTTDAGTSTTRTPAAGAGLNGQIADSTLQALAGLVEQAARPDGMARLLSVAAPPTALGTQDVADLQASVRELQQVVAEHKAAIERLSPRS